MAPSWVSHSLPFSHPLVHHPSPTYISRRAPSDPRPRSFVTESSSLPKVEGGQLLGRQKYRVTTPCRKGKGKMEEEKEEDRGRNTKGTREQVTEIRRFIVTRNNWVEGPSGERGQGSILHRVDTGEGCFRSRVPRAASQVPLEAEIGGVGGWRGMILVLGRPGRLRLSLGLCASIL